uniref:Putative dna damage-regulated autophagy modulator protein 1 n=1 Tax=Rhipicephalus pulchellus TaxID=72859 RepID=L7M5T8_RHIPC
MEIKVSKLHWFPWIFVFTMTITVMIVYAWSVLIGDVPVFLPYVSDAGGNPPQSALFGLALIACIISGLIPMVVRFFAVRAVECKHKKFVTLLNYLSLISGVLAGVGLAMVATNPVSHIRRDGTWLLPVLLPHIAGAGLTFVFSTGYFIIQAMFVWLLGRDHCRPMLGYARIVSTVASIGGALAMAAFAPFNSLEDFKPNPNRGTIYRGLSPWSSVGEWILILGLMCNFLTLSADMKAINITVNLENVVVNSEAQQEKESNNEMMKF